MMACAAYEAIPYTHSLESAAVWAVVRPRVLPSIFLRVNAFVRSKPNTAWQCFVFFVASRFLIEPGRSDATVLVIWRADFA